MNRLHQFNKVEIVRIDTPEHSYQSLDEMIAHVESLVQKLELPYTIMVIVMKMKNKENVSRNEMWFYYEMILKRRACLRNEQPKWYKN